MSTKVRKFYLCRQDRFYSPTGWWPQLDNALRFDTRDDAQNGLADMRRQVPVLFRGDVQVVEREFDEGAGGPMREVQTEYDPFNVRSA